MKQLTSMILVALVVTAPPVLAGDIRTERVQFARGASSTVVEGSITGRETVDYVLGARKGQSMNVSMRTDNTGNYFNILAPGENEVAMFNGSMGGTQYRVIFFDKGQATGADTSQADPGKFSASKQDDLSSVRIGQERYEIPDAVIFGG